jgi:hypothetical protein
MTDSAPDQGIGKFCKNLASDTVVFGKHKYTLTNHGVAYSEKSICQACEALSARQYAAANKDKIIENKKRHKDKHRGTIKYHVQEKISTWRKASCVPSDLTVDYLISLYEQQNGYCFYSGEKMIFGWVDGKIQYNSLSLDKLDPSKGYIQGNVVWCSYLTNTMKQDMKEHQFYDYMKKILIWKSKI